MLWPHEQNRHIKRLCGILLALCLFSAGATASNLSAEYQRVVILHSFHKGQKWNDDLSNGIEDVLKNRNIELNFEYMDTIRFPDSAHSHQLIQMYKTKYKDRKADIVISTDEEALDFLLINRRSLFPNTPIVYCGVKSYIDRFWEPGLTGVIEPIDLSSNVRLAKKLNPSLKQIFVVMDNTPTSISLINNFITAIKTFSPAINFIFSDFTPFDDLLKEIRTLSRNSAVFLVNYTNDKSGRMIPMDESARQITQNSPVPVYSAWDSYIGQGVLGGKLVSSYTQGKTAAEMALAILQGKPLEEIPVKTNIPSQYIFDYDQLKKFNIQETDLPDESVILNQPDTLYQRYKKLMFTFLLGGISLSLIILLLSLNIMHRRRMEKALKRYSGRLNFLHRMDQSILNHFSLKTIGKRILRPTLFHINCDLIGIYLFKKELDPEWGFALNRNKINTLIDNFSIPTHHLPANFIQDKTPLKLDDRPSQLRNLLFNDHRFSGFNSYLLIPMVYQNKVMGIFFLAHLMEKPIELHQKMVSQQIAHTLAMAIENHYLFNKIKTHEAKLKQLSINIIEAQELERKRLSAELHDEFGQSLTAIGINFSVIRKKINGTQAAGINTRMEEIEQAIEGLSDQVHDLSLNLRPPMLDDLGLIPTVRWFLNQYHERNGIKINFSLENNQDIPVPNQVAVAMYRVVQEALNNITKHANASCITLRLDISSTSISLHIKDDGTGFNMDQLKLNKPGRGGLGLIGMKDRLDLLDGHMKIQSFKDRGTTLQAVAPI
ncbi:MAG: ABC transporter substrate binding protein [Desulfobacterium sp.]